MPRVNGFQSKPTYIYPLFMTGKRQSCPLDRGNLVYVVSMGGMRFEPKTRRPIEALGDSVRSLSTSERTTPTPKQLAPATKLQVHNRILTNGKCREDFLTGLKEQSFRGKWVMHVVSGYFKPEHFACDLSPLRYRMNGLCPTFPNLGEDKAYHF